MCAPSRLDSELPPWLHSGLTLAWRHRTAIGQIIGLAAAIAAATGVYWHGFSPSDLERADADLQRARLVINSLDKESTEQLGAARGHKNREAEIRKALEERKDTTDKAWVACREAMAHRQSELFQAKNARGDNLLYLNARYLRLLAEAECEVLRAKDSRDRGTPCRVAPRVRELLAPILADR